MAFQARYSLISKSSIPSVFRRFGLQADPLPFIAAAHVFPMRANNHVVEDLIDWSNVPSDPMFQLSFPQPAMLHSNDLSFLTGKITNNNTSKVQMRTFAEVIRRKMNPHPANQKQENVPMLNGFPVPGIQHKYRETVLFFPSEGQFCHAFCTYCFRWAQFTSVGSDQAFKSGDRDVLVQYLRTQPQVTDVLFTGGDPVVMPASVFRHYMEPIIGPNGIPHISTVRIGTKSLAWWPYRFLSDPDSSELLTLFSEIVASGRQLAIQAHFSHTRELEHPATQEAIRLIRMTGAQIRCQAPLIRHVNDSPNIWRDMWNLQVRLGLVPYYMFVERDTGASEYFGQPLINAYNIFSKAYSQLSGTARTVRGPSMSAAPGKVCVIGKESVAGREVFVLKFLQARNPRWTQRTFFAEYDPEAVWFDDLRPAFSQKHFFEDEYNDMRMNGERGSSGQLDFEKQEPDN